MNLCIFDGLPSTKISTCLNSRPRTDVARPESETMEPDDHVCLCFHVSKRKLVNFIRIERPVRVGQISQCQGAGTGCGWCRPVLKQLFEQHSTTTEISSRYGENEAHDASTVDLDSLSPGQYQALRSKYVEDGGGTPPPGAAPT